MPKPLEKKPEASPRPLGRIVVAYALVRVDGLVAPLKVELSLLPDGEGDVLGWKLGQEDARAIATAKCSRDLAEVQPW